MGICYLRHIVQGLILYIFIISYLICDFFSNIIFEFSSDYFIHETLYQNYSEKIYLKGYGLLYKSEASLQIPKPGRSLVNIKYRSNRKGANNKSHLGTIEEDGRSSIPNNFNGGRSMEMMSVSSRQDRPSLVFWRMSEVEGQAENRSHNISYIGEDNVCKMSKRT